MSNGGVSQARLMRRIAGRECQNAGSSTPTLEIESEQLHRMNGTKNLHYLDSLSIHLTSGKFGDMVS